MITIYSPGGVLKYTLPAIQASRLHQSLNGECLFDFNMPGRFIPDLAVGDEVQLGDLYFTVVRVAKQTTAAGATFAISCEHVSYQLADELQTAAHFSGTVAAVLAEILSGTSFTVGRVEIPGTFSVTINNDTNKRSALQEWAAATGAELSYSGRAINFLSRVGSAVPRILSDVENVAALSVTLDSRSETQSYAVTLSRLQTLALGDAVTIRYTSLDLDTTTRVITLDYDPFHPWTINMVTGDHIPDFTGAVSAALEARLREGQPYFGVTIDREQGLKIARSDGMSEAIFNSDFFTMRALIDGVMRDRIYFDPIKGDYVFDGALGADAVFTDSLYAEQGDIAELTVDRLSTSRRIRKYILGDTSDDNYIDIQDNYIRFVTGRVVTNAALATGTGAILLTSAGNAIQVSGGGQAGVVIQAKNRYGSPLYWQREPVGHTADGYPTDADGQQIYTVTEETSWPVYQYKYSDLVKAREEFELVGNNYQPKFTFGAGDENGNSKGFIVKEQTDLLMRYISSAGKNVDLLFSDQGFIDAIHRRLSSLIINPESGIMSYTVEGDETVKQIYFQVTGNTVVYTWPDGHKCTITMGGSI